MGIITGVDIMPGGKVHESEYLDLLRGELFQLGHEWHAVRNLSFEDRESERPNRDAAEREFFDTREVWRAIPEEKRGAPQLKSKLSDTLLSHISRELGAVMSALNDKIDHNEKVLQQLGDRRSTMSEKRVYLNKIGAQYQNLTVAAVKGIYEDEGKFFEKPANCLCARIAEEFDAFEKDMSKGHRWEWTLPDDASNAPSTPSIGTDQDHDDTLTPYNIKPSDYLIKVDEVRLQYRGRELPGLSNPGLVGVLFKDQSCRWKDIATSAIKKIVKIIKKFLQRVAERLVEPRRAQLLLRHNLLPAMDEREQAITAKLDELIKPFHKYLPRTQNPSFEERFNRLDKETSESGWGICATGNADDNGEDNAIKDLAACRKLALSMASYYHIARVTFVDNVVTLGVELCLLDGLADILAPATIFEMADKQVDRIASEFPDDAKKRKRAENDLKALLQGRDICREYEYDGDLASAPEPDPQTPEEEQPSTSRTPTRIKEESVNVGLPTPPSTSSERLFQMRRSETAESEL